MLNAKAKFRIRLNFRLNADDAGSRPQVMSNTYGIADLHGAGQDRRGTLEILEAQGQPIVTIRAARLGGF
jgi:hypothetical protein